MLTILLIVFFPDLADTGMTADIWSYNRTRENTSSKCNRFSKKIFKDVKE